MTNTTEAIDPEIIEAQLERIAAARERIADRLDYIGEDGALSVDTEVRG